MAGLVLAAAGQAIGASIGGTVLGVSSAVIGQAVGAVVGSAIDAYLFAPNIRNSQEGPRLQEANVMTSSEGLPITRGTVASKSQAMLSGPPGFLRRWLLSQLPKAVKVAGAV